MSETAMRVTEAKQQLENAQRALRDEEREKAKLQLAEVRTKLREAEAAYVRLAARVKREDSILAQRQSKINAVVQLLEASTALRPSVADILPNDPEVTEWKAAHDRLLAQRDQAIKEREAFRAMTIGHNQAAQYEDTPGPGVISRLRYQEAALIMKLRGEVPGGGWKSSISFVR
jgi:hypothetical protein